MPHIPESQDTSDILRACLNFLPQQTTERILSRLQHAINYEPVIGIMGKSGAGKSSLCNALFQQPVCLTSDLLGCTREPQRIVLTVGERSMTLVDLPGVGETPEYDAEYSALYQKLLTELDLIIWVLRADDRARTVDIVTHRSLLAYGADASRFLFVISQADRIPPLPELAGQVVPSTEQCLSLAVISSQIAGQLPSSFPVMAVSAHTGYNLHALVELMIHALPVQASSAFYCQLKPENHTEESDVAVRQRFGEIAGSAFDTVIASERLPSGWSLLLRRLREKLVQLASELWERIFG
ncbi:MULTISPECIES: GTPase family protein [Klebsiella pneumoniae complex]|uniref:GTPase family protein n=1 Tax=Klebsiella pneumoniae complex TaxID=3390273 RepID=UPI002074A3AE|nr:GTPase [Klebsiella quasipneumoniae]MCM6349121.1 50S ribosome-binding GTPase [Klebsiella pneumoniae]HCR1032196.1 50S ribosome-binding GTPase [Klebsiella aerogenes]MCP6087866.1 50S ribosome-binding GTPase [Klebsiella pneumoniae]GKP12831.1 GTP-binding protein [Klebsiella quasipneumoniae]HCD3000725.1 50S ribosome-binding GTPase [Klebsiella pneumoniae]